MAIAGYLAFLALRLYMPIACPVIVTDPSVPSPFPNSPTLLENQGPHILLKAEVLGTKGIAPPSCEHGWGFYCKEEEEEAGLRI